MLRYLPLLLFIILSNVGIAQKQVLFEKFTNAYCGVCPDATLQLKDLVAEYPDLIWISHHKPVSWTDNPLTNEQSIAIWDDLNISGVPKGMVDRTFSGSNITLSRSLWEQRVLEQSDNDALFNIEIKDVSYEPNSTRELAFEVEAEALLENIEGPFRLTVFIVEDEVTGTEQHSYWNDVAGHPLEGMGDVIWSYSHSNVVRSILNNHWGESDIVPNNPTVGTTYNKSYSYLVPEAYDAEQIQIVAKISYFDEENNYPGQVLNASKTVLSDLDIKLTNSKTEFLSETTLTISPNPTTDFARLSYTELPSAIKLINNTGKVLKEIRPNALETTLDLSNLPKGSYYLMSNINDVWHGELLLVQ